MNASKQSEDTGLVLFVCAMTGVLFVLPAWYAAHVGGVNGILLGLAKAQLWAFSVFSDEAREALVRIARAKPEAMPWETVLKVLEYSGSWARWPYLAMLAALGTAGVLLGRVGGLTRHFNMSSLLVNNEKSFPCLHPIVGRGKYLLDPKSFDSGAWRIARTPVQFALEHGLLLHEKDGVPLAVEDALTNGLPVVPSKAYGHALLDTQKAGQVFCRQLGGEYAGFDALSTPRKVMASALLAYAAGEKKACVALLDAAALSYVEQEGIARCAIFEQVAFQERVKALWQRHEPLLASSPLLQRHCPFEVPLFMALMYQARRKGVLACSQFLWLRPIDRPLWYALNQCGGKAAWIEALAPWVHYVAEEEKGTPITSTGATEILCVNRLRDTLDEQGWIGTEGEIFGCVAAGNNISALMNPSTDTLDVRQELAKEGLVSGETQE